MGDFPRPFSGGENKKQKREESVKQALNAVMQGVQEAGRFASTMRFGKPAKTRVFDFKEDDKLADAVRFASTMRFGKQEAKEAPSERTKEMGGPNMISTGMAGVDPMTGMPQANQLAPTAINPNALGSMQPQIPSIAGTPQAGSYNNVMPQPAQAGIAPPLQHDKKYQHTHVAEDTDEIQKDNISEYVVNMYNNDTLRPVGKKFNPNKTSEGYLMGGTYPTVKISKKNFKLKK